MRVAAEVVRLESRVRQRRDARGAEHPGAAGEHPGTWSLADRCSHAPAPELEKTLLRSSDGTCPARRPATLGPGKRRGGPCTTPSRVLPHRLASRRRCGSVPAAVRSPIEGAGWPGRAVVGSGVRVHACWALGLAVVSMGMGCARGVRPPCENPPPVYLKLEGAPRLNPDERGQPLVTQVLVFQTRGVARAEAADLNDLRTRPQEVLGDSR